MILVDTTVWIDFFAAKETVQVSKLIQIIQQEKDLCIIGVVLTEILQGIKNPKEHKQVHILLDSLFYLETKKEVFVLAAEIYRTLRMRGITIRKTLDCIIAASAIQYHVPLLHNDRDFDPIEKYFDLLIY